MYWAWILCCAVLQALQVVSTTSCPPPAVPINCKVEVNEATATYTCDDGYTLFGSATRTCDASGGSWAGDLPICATNIAYKRPANQSSTSRNSEAGKANDGHITHLHEGSQCAVTSKEASPWWRVDLLQEYEVVVVVVTTRACCDTPALQNLEIRVGNSLDIQKNRLCAWEPGNVEEGKRITYRCALALRGQYVILQTVGRESELSLCEVQVFSTEEFAKERCSTTADINTIGVFNKTCYQFNQEGTSFERARQQCKQSDSTITTSAKSPGDTNSDTSHNENSHNGTTLRPDLAHTISGVTHNFLTSELDRSELALKGDLVWIGVKRDPGFISRTWRWVDGTVVTEPKWGRAQPNNYNGKQDCVALDRGRKWLWNDVGCELDYLPFVCMYAPRSCGSPDKQVNTTLEVTGHTTGSRAQYKCPTGSKLVGNTSRTCLETGLWSGEAPSCKYIDCGAPEDIDNGQFTYTGEERNTYMAKITYTCAQNYSLDGAHVRLCADDAVWTPKTPACLYARCPELPTPPHATVQADSNSNSAGGTITYTCDAGYRLVGEETLSCKLGGDWSSRAPSCLFTDCGLPPQPSDGQAVLLNKTTTYGSQVSYKCGPNFWLSGSELRTCGEDGQWTGTDPECVLITCGEPEVPVGGYLTGYSFQVGAEVEYFCDEGHRLETPHGPTDKLHQQERDTIEQVEGKTERDGANRESEDDLNEFQASERIGRVERATNPMYARTCGQDGTWSGAPPLCVYTDCGHVQAVPKASIAYTGQHTHLGSTVTYTCPSGYRLKGNGQRQCTREGKWSGSSPVCEAVRCPAPPSTNEPTSAFLKLISGNDRRLPSLYGRRGRGREREREGESYRVGSVATYECPKGYVVNTTATTTPATTAAATTTIATAATTAALLTCTSNGSWSGPVPDCSYVDCGLPEKIVNGFYRLLSNTTHFGSQVAYECITNYRIQGRIRRNCQVNGTWAGLSPTCEEIRCPSLSAVLTDALSVEVEDGGIVDSTATYSCAKGRRIVGNSQRTCSSNGLWSGSQPRCEWVTCDQPAGIKNGRVVRLNETLLYGALVEYHCLPEFKLFGVFIRSCEANGAWSKDAPVCVGKDEEYTVLDGNSVAGDSSGVHGTAATTATNTGLYIGLVFGLLLVIVFISVLVYFRMKQQRGREGGGGGGGGREWKTGGGGGERERPPLPPPNDQKTTPTMTYSNLTDPITGNNIYENIDEEEEEVTRGGGRGDDYYNNYNNNYHHYQNTSGLNSPSTTTTPTTTTPTTTIPLAGINRTTAINSTRRPRLPPPQPPTIPTTAATNVTINGVTIAETV